MAALERVILETLQFSVQWAGPTPYLDRYVRVMGLEHEPLVIRVARELCRSMTTDCKLFLTLRPSELAAASLVIALNFTQSPSVCKQIGIAPLQGKVNPPSPSPLSWWTPELQDLCRIPLAQILPVYT